MKTTGIVRKVDGVGRFVLPSELRKVFGIKDNGGALELFVEDDAIILKRYEPACVFCGNADGVKVFKGRNVCKHCAAEIASLK